MPVGSWDISVLSLQQSCEEFGKFYVSMNVVISFTTFVNITTQKIHIQPKYSTFIKHLPKIR